MVWQKHLEDSWFRKEDQAYAGKDHTKKNKTFICIYYDKNKDKEVERSGFRTLKAAMKHVDENCP